MFPPDVDDDASGSPAGIANADAAGSSHTDAAIEQAYRAVREVVESRAAEYVSRFT